MTIALAKVQAATAAEICARYDPGDDVRALIRRDARPGDLLAALQDAGLLIEAVQYLAFGLPRREAVWWACLCTRSELTPATTPEQVQALQAAEAWAFQPTEPNRQVAGAAGEATQMEHPSGWAAMAAYWSGGSMVRPELPPVEPAPNLTALAVYGAVATAGQLRGAEVSEERYREYLQRGIDLANGGTGHV